MFDPNNPMPQVPGQMNIMGALTGAPQGGQRPPMPGGGQPSTGGGFQMPSLPGGMQMPQIGGVTPGQLPQAGGPSRGPGIAGGGGYQGDNPRIQAIMQALQGFRDARQAWQDGGRVGERPVARDYFGNIIGANGWGGQSQPGGVVPPGTPNSTVPGQPAGMVGSSLGVAGATPAASGFELPTY